MKLVKDFPRSVENWDFNTTITVGTFDGVHIGHKQILQKVAEYASNNNEKSLVVTFDRHPISVLKPEVSPKLITTLDEKCSLFEELGIDITCVLSFNKQISELTSRHFIEKFLINSLKMRTLVAGYDHGFGKKNEDITISLQELAEALHFTLKVFEPVKHNGLIVKSSEIRLQISEGNMEIASEMLGVDYSISGKVIKGNNLGEKIGIPTANLEPESTEKIIPPRGVYAGWVELEGKRKQSVISIGSRPTFNIEYEAIEAHILDFTGNLYGKKIRIGFIKRLRDIFKFESQNELVNQINIDIKKAKEFTLP
ncbi:MAG: bifunctional riboflavin kinase/FAD synthetase [Candidatus Latescibacteria bacterium]|nr:bifunctional riboflavin kinase/FAD synthetase [Candidatus Latescibacterota bacterium]